MRTILAVGILATAALFASCDGEESKKETAPVVDESPDSTSENHTRLNFDALPSPLRISYLFYQAHLDFQEPLLLPVEQYDGFSLNTERLVAFGMYSSDLAYAAFNQRDDIAKKRFNLIERISSDLSFSFPEENEQLVVRFEQNITQIDSIIHLLSRYQMMVDDYIQQNGDQDKAIIIFSSAWIETLYLGCSVKNLEVNPELLETLIYQQELCDVQLANLEAITNYDGDQKFEDLRTHMRNIYAAFQEIGLPENETEEFEIKRVALHKLVDTVFEARKIISTNQAS
jgi:hypothetical protein